MVQSVIAIAGVVNLAREVTLRAAVPDRAAPARVLDCRQAQV
jgi:hypothetical protein